MVIHGNRHGVSSKGRDMRGVEFPDWEISALEMCMVKASCRHGWRR
jgi:hypothetical protein